MLLAKLRNSFPDRQASFNNFGVVVQQLIRRPLLLLQFRLRNRDLLDDVCQFALRQVFYEQYRVSGQRIAVYAGRKDS